MNRRSRSAAGRIALLALVLTFLCYSLTSAAKGPSGWVDDQSATLKPEQLAKLEEGLKGLRYNYRVIILSRAFPEEQPADAGPRLHKMAEESLTRLGIPRDAVLITVALKERLTDFQVWPDGPLNASFRWKTGDDFAYFTPRVQDAYRGPASANDVPGAILAAVKLIETLIPVDGAIRVRPLPGESVEAPSAHPTPAPPVPEPTRPIAESAPKLAGWSVNLPIQVNHWLFLGAGAGIIGGLLLIFGLVRFSGRAREFRRLALDAIAVQESYHHGLVELQEQIHQCATIYQGPETIACIRLAADAADPGFKANAVGDYRRQEAVRLRLTLRFARAGVLLKEARLAYEEAAAAAQEVRTAWAPAASALQDWDGIVGAFRRQEREAESRFREAQSRSGWPLTSAGRRLHDVAAMAAEADGIRHTDPVRAARVIREAGNRVLAVGKELENLSHHVEALRFAEEQIGRLESEITTTQRTLGLRFDELSPMGSMGQAHNHERTALTHLQDGAFANAIEELGRVDAAIAHGLQILNRYREGFREYPLKMRRLQDELISLDRDRLEASSLLADLQASYVRDDWLDLVGIPDQIREFTFRVRTGLEEVALLTSSARQEYLKATDMLDRWQVELQHLRLHLQSLRLRSGELAELRHKAESDTQVALEGLQSLESILDGTGIRLPSHLSADHDDVKDALAQMAHWHVQSPVPVSRWSQEATAVRQRIGLIRTNLDSLASQRAAGELERMRARATPLLAAHGSSREAADLENNLLAAERAFQEGRFEAVLRAGPIVDQCCDRLEGDG